MEERKCDRCKEAVCIQTMQIYDSCKSKECVDDIRVYFTASSQSIIDSAISVKAKEAEIIWVFSDVEPVPFNKGFYTVDIKYFFKVTLDVYCGATVPSKVSGLAVYEKKIVLFGSEGSAKIFSSKYRENEADIQNFRKTNLPEAIVEVVDPIILSAKVSDECKCGCGCDCQCIPSCVCRLFDEPLVTDVCKKVYVSLGLFTIIKLERNVQILIPAYDFCLPDKECVPVKDDNPCELFGTLDFPVDEFFPPTKCDYEDTSSCGCND